LGLAQIGHAGLNGPETPLDTRRKQALIAHDKIDNPGPENPAYPRPNLSLRGGYSEKEYQWKVLAIFGLVDFGVAPASRKAEANKFLRHTFGDYPADTAGDIRGQYASAWSHESRNLAIRIYALYSHWLEPDVKATYDQRLDWLCTDPFNDKSENIKFTNNSAYFLAHEIRNKTGLPSYGAVKTWLLDAMKAFGKDGAHEWGTNYNAWTASAILNLAEFAQDSQIKKLATMCLDYYWARKSGFSHGGLEASGAVRRYPHWLFAAAPPMSEITTVLFFGPDSNPMWMEWAASNFKPLAAVASLYNAGPLEAKVSERGWKHTCYRGAKYAIATQMNFQDDYYSSTHDVVSVYVQSAKGVSNHVIPNGNNITDSTKWRCTNERGWGYKNIGFHTAGGLCRRTWTGGEAHNIPLRVFCYKDFTYQIQGNWAFMTDGVIYVAWAPTIGDPIFDPNSANLADPNKMGYFLRSNHTPDDLGETSVTEAGDAASHGTFDAFKNDILARNPNPRWVGGQVTYKARDGANLVYSRTGASINGAAVNPAAHPRCKMPGVDGYTITGAGITFNFDAISTTGTLTRVAANMTFGGANSALSITTSSVPNGSVGKAYGPVTFNATGGAAPYAWSLVSGALPGGVTLSNSGVLSGTPSGAGMFTFQVQVRDSAGATSTRPFTLTVTSPVVVTTSSLPIGCATKPYGPATLSAQGGTGSYVEWLVVGGALPPGVTLASNGVVSGTPTTAGAYSFTVRVKDSANATATRALAITIHPRLVIATPSPLPIAVVNKAYNQVFVAQGGSGTYVAWTVIDGALPPGVGLLSNGALSGAPTTAGTYTFRVRVRDSLGFIAGKAFTLVVNPPLAITTPAALPPAKKNVAYGPIKLTATGGSGTYTRWVLIDGALPPGLTLDPAGVIQGTPTMVGNFSARIRVIDSTGAVTSRMFAISVTR
jgi:hypothetical protein